MFSWHAAQARCVQGQRAAAAFNLIVPARLLLACRRRTEEGFAIYSESELGLGRAGGGNTPLCPFDCECCF